MTEREKIEIVLLGSRFETMNKYVDLSHDDGTISKCIAKAMQEYAERYHISKVKENELLHSVSYCACDFKDKDLAKTSHLVCNDCKKAL